MRKLIVLLLLCAGGYYLYMRQGTNAAAVDSFTLPETLAWKEVTWSGTDPNPTMTINLVDKGRWRLEAKSTSKANVLVAVFNGSQFACSNPKATSDPKAAGNLDPRMAVSKVLADVSRSKLVETEQRDGHTCWHFSSRTFGVGEDVWVDTRTRFPVYFEGTGLDGTRARARYSLVAVDLAAGGARYFDLRTTSALFSASLIP